MDNPVISKEEFAKSLNLDKFQLELLAVPLMKLLKIDKVNHFYGKLADKEGMDFVAEILQQLGVQYEVSEEELLNIPTKGSLIVVANHPYGGIDSLLLLSVLSRIRPDVKVMTNVFLQSIPQLKEFFMPASLESEGKKKTGDHSTKPILDILEQGGVACIFPAGEVAHFRVSSKEVTDTEWHGVVGKIIEKTKASVLPVYFSGSNSLMFNILGMINRNLQNAKLPSEMLNKQENKIVVRIGKPISATQLGGFADTAQMLRFLRVKTYALGSSLKVGSFFRNPFKVKIEPETIIDAVPTEKLEDDIRGLRQKNLMLFSHQNYEIYVAEITDIQNIMREIGRLREITFRSEGEGTNRSIDIDEYDMYYNHLFIWDSEASRIVGAYRIGRGADLYQKFKAKGFYLNELFKMDKNMHPILQQSLEMGRSFIVEDYQRKHISLFLLWKGVLLYLRNNPEYRYLIGPVSISNNFSSLSKELMVKFIQENHYDWQLAKFIKPKKRFKPDLKPNAASEILFKQQNLKNLKDLDSLISEIEASHAKVPVLLKKYISQNSKIIGFNIDPKFNDALDGFLIMDLQNVPEDTIKMLDKTS